jgi:superfamily II DNA or RNA helicase
MKTTVLELVDEVNCKFHNLDIITRKKLVEEVSYFLPYARHTPAFKLGRWDGKVRYCDIGARSYINLLDRLLPIVQEQGYDVDLVDNRHPTQFSFEKVAADSYSEGMWPLGHVCAGEPIVLRDYQIEIINEFLANPQGVQCISTGAGKTLVTAILSHKVEKYGRSIVIVPSKQLVTQTEKYGRSIVIVPSKQLVTQTEADYKNLGLDVGVFFGDRKEYFRQHTICTWQSLEALNKKSKDFDPDITLDDFIDNVQCIIVDEAHGAKADALKKLMTTTFSNVPLRWGMTGTIPEDEYEAIALYASIGPLLHSVTAKELQDKGVLSNLHVHVQQLKDPVRVFSNYQAELAWLSSDKVRIEWLAEHVIEQEDRTNAAITHT